jgi:DNA-binding transcriptional MerR regulator
LNKAPDAFRTISEVADELNLPQHVLRFWESRFPHIKPLKRGGGRRYYRPEDIDLLRGIRRLLYAEGYTIRGVQRILREQGVRSVQSVGQGQAPDPAPPQDNGHDPEVGPNGTSVAVDLLAPPESMTPDDEGEDSDGQEPYILARSWPAPQNRPIADAGSEAATPAARLQDVQVHQRAVAATPVAVGASSSPGIAASDLDRLKHALAELEACRRLLDKAIEGRR